MKDLFHGIILLSLVAQIDVTLQACVEGEPKIGEPEPDLNITISPSTKISEGNNLEIICDANSPRLLMNSDIRPLPPVVIRIFVGDARQKSCRGNPVHKCVHFITNINKTFPRTVGCMASNSGGECRFKLLQINITNRRAVSATITGITLPRYTPRLNRTTTVSYVGTTITNTVSSPIYTTLVNPATIFSTAVKRTDIVSPTKSMDPTLSSKTSAQLVCQGSVMTLSCRSKWLALSIQSAFYGREYPRSIICPRPPTSDSAEFSCFVKDAYPIVKRICDGKANCSISANKSTFKDPCPNVYKYLSVTYKCVSTLRPTKIGTTKKQDSRSSSATKVVIVGAASIVVVAVLLAYASFCKK